MESKEFISIHQFCEHYNVPISFIYSLKEVELIEVIICRDTECIRITHIKKLEKMIRLHFELNINIEGLDAVNNLLQQIEQLNQENLELKDRLNFKSDF